MLGTASSAYQIEGAWNDEGKRNIMFLYNVVVSIIYFIQPWINTYLDSLLMN